MLFLNDPGHPASGQLGKARLSSGCWKSRVKGKGYFEPHQLSFKLRVGSGPLPNSATAGVARWKGALSRECSESRPEVQRGGIQSPGLGLLWSTSGAQHKHYILLPTASPPRLSPHTSFPYPFLFFPVALITTDTILYMDLFAYCLSHTTI